MNNHYKDILINDKVKAKEELDFMSYKEIRNLYDEYMYTEDIEEHIKNNAELTEDIDELKNNTIPLTHVLKAIAIGAAIYNNISM